MCMRLALEQQEALLALWQRQLRPHLQTLVDQPAHNEGIDSKA